MCKWERKEEIGLRKMSKKIKSEKDKRGWTEKVEL